METQHRFNNYRPGSALKLLSNVWELSFHNRYMKYLSVNYGLYFRREFIELVLIVSFRIRRYINIWKEGISPDWSTAVDMVDY